MVGTGDDGVCMRGCGWGGCRDLVLMSCGAALCAAPLLLTVSSCNYAKINETSTVYPEHYFSLTRCLQFKVLSEASYMKRQARFLADVLDIA
jgi:hypothetical protein